jgi:hypothetical protein
VTRPLIALSATALLVALLACKALNDSAENAAEAAVSASVTPSVTAEAPSVASASASKDDWVLFSPGGGDFKLRLPQQPKLERHNTQTSGGPVELSLFTATGGSGAAYQVGYSDFPQARLGQHPPARMLRDAQAGAVRKLEGKLLSEREFKVLGHPARDYSIEVVRQGMTLSYWGRMILVGARMYQLQVIGLAGQVKDTDRQRFFESFELTERTK